MDLIVQGLARKFQAERGLDALQDDELFETFAAHCVVSQFFEGEFDPDRLRMGQGGDLGIDAVAVLLNGELFTDVVEVKAAAAEAHEVRAHFVIIQAKTSPHFQTKVFTDLADNLVHIFTAKTLTYECSDEVRDFRAAIEAVYAEVGKLSPELPRLSVWYATTGTLRGDGLLEEKRLAATRRLEATHRFGTVDVKAVGAREVRELYQRSTDAVSAKITMDKRVTLPPVPGIKQAFLGLLPARELVDRMLTHPAGGMRRTLFHENVRDFQDYNAVNQEIRHTLRDEFGRRQFAVLNNGITIVTRKLTTAGDEFQLRDFQIVNGCQTCHVLFDEREAFDDTVFVNVRLIESTDEGVISRIIKATNQQTAVSDDDLSARDEFHRQLEDYFANQPRDRRLFYERRSKQYTARPDVEKTRILTRPQIARAYAAMFLDETTATGHYKRLIQTRGDDLFQSSHPPLPYYTSAAAYYRLEWLLRNRRLPTVYGPARFHLLAGIRLRLVGKHVPRNHRSLTNACTKILDVMWNLTSAEELVQSLVPAVLAAKAAEGDNPPTLGDLVRTKRFDDNFRQALLTRRTGTTASDPGQLF